MVYVCPECDYEAEDPGACPDCGIILEEKMGAGASSDQSPEMGSEEGFENEDEDW